MRGVLWVLFTAMGLVGGIGSVALSPYLALPLLIVGGFGLLALGVQDARVGRNPGALLGAGGGAGVLIAALLARQWSTQVPPHWALAVVGLGVQVVVLSLRMPPSRLMRGAERTAVPIVGHAFALAGVAGVAVGPPVAEPAPLLAALVGFTILFVEVMWMRRQADRDVHPGQSWEAVLLVMLAGTLILGVVVAFLGQGLPRFTERSLEAILRINVIIGLAVLARPPEAPDRWTLVPGGVGEFWVNSLSFLVVLDVAIALLFFGAPALVAPLFFAFTGFLLLAVALEYTASIYAIVLRARRRIDPVLVGPLPPITVVMAAKNEAEVLARSLEHNLESMRGVSFLVALGGADPESRAAIKGLQETYPGRIRLAPASGLSKATDLNQAWRFITTPYAWMLDADETSSERALRIAVKRIEADRSIGIVQGRKAPRAVDHDVVARAIAAERRFSTLLDQTAYADLFDAAHFAGSAALVRKEVPMTVGGWRPTTLTEDIEFTVRLHLAGKYRVVYDDRIIVDEDVPHDFAAFLRQRGRWARGWSHVAAIHMKPLIKAGPRIGWRRTIGLGNQLVTAVNAPWAVLLPVLGAIWYWQGSPHMAPRTGVILAAVILPSRLLSYQVAFWSDRRRPRRRVLLRALEVVIMSYGWIAMGWFLQLHALYLEFSGAPRRWLRTRSVEQAAAEAIEAAEGAPEEE